MAKMIQKLVSKNKTQSTPAMTCNYQNNYYGDQVCVACTPVKGKQA